MLLTKSSWHSFICNYLSKCVRVCALVVGGGGRSQIVNMMYFVLTPPLPVLSRCVLSCPGCCACASGSVWRPFSCVRPLSTTPSSSTTGRGPDEPASTWSVSPFLSPAVGAAHELSRASQRGANVFFKCHLFSCRLRPLLCYCCIPGVVAQR